MSSFEIENFDNIVIDENYFFETLKRERKIPSDNDLINIPFKYLILIKTSIQSKSVELTSNLVLLKEVWKINLNTSSGICLKIHTSFKKHKKIFELLYAYLLSFINEDRIFNDLDLFLTYFHHFINYNHHFKSYVKSKIVRPVTKELDFFVNNSTFKMINEHFSRLSNDLDYLEESNSIDWKTTLSDYCNIVIKIIDALFLIKGIFLEEVDDKTPILSNFCGKVLCKMLIFDLEILTNVILQKK